MKIRQYRPGPGMMVSAAFIGPGTVTACTLAGANFGFALVWALVFATVTTILLQSFAVRVALVSRMGLAEAMMQTVRSRALRILAALLLMAALALGNAAYEAGNISGALLGVEALYGGELGPVKPLIILAIALLAATLILFSKPLWVERLLIAMVMLMSLAFLLTFVLIKPDFRAIFAGFIPRVPDGGLMTAIALIGTTIVPYNLFLHAASVRQRWHTVDSLDEAQTDSVISIGIGGLVSITILATAAAALFSSGKEISNAVDMAGQLSPLFGRFSSMTLGAGLFAAGLTSAITAPLATGYIVQEIFGKTGDEASKLPFRLGSLVVILSGTFGALLNYSPVEIIFVAQIANGLLLPIIAAFLLRLANDKKLLGEHTNNWKANLAGIFILSVTSLLGVRLIARALGYWP
ncbi:Nramp family divalent metal transporter [Parasphingorhabdus halotolerans]|uniref:Nramp family divalent metal transporter n=1 Tax=Parasphingorhabdus halotolerans TaxID=2725558 RepID=A0A6H2DQU7_9SPHN|nr:Nramp family divalent metal transporter [Parasphingorhabdus halotolerans]QJB70578.1 Nramp family divalent metal transporter [Parasphingorhabdus halotolerans]